MSEIHSGGCQCGAVRFQASKLGRPSICHCRMCQKQFGSFFGAFVTADQAHLTWTRGQPMLFPELLEGATTLYSGSLFENIYLGR